MTHTPEPIKFELTDTRLGDAYDVRALRRLVGPPCQGQIATGIMTALLDGGATYLSPLSRGIPDGVLTHGAPTYEYTHRED